MTIKEIEERCGMTRANIRFYETEGLITPQREKNGYRDYSDEDLQILMKIKLLRALHISLEDIKALQSGNNELKDTLSQHIQALEEKKKDLECSQTVCKKMYDDGAKYGTLNAQRYLDYMERSFKESSVIFGENTWEEDVTPKEIIPWRRYFARSLDMSFYGFLWSLFLIHVCNVNIQGGNSLLNVINTIMVPVLMLVAEPILLTVFGTTVGKWVLGLYVTDLEGEKPGYQECFQRTLSVMWHGLGLEIPVFVWVRLYKSYKSCTNGEDMAWEYRTNVCLKDEKGWRIAVYIATYVCMIAMLTVSVMWARMPKNRGDITVAEFCEDFNNLSEQYELFADSDLTETGKWTTQEIPAGQIVIYTTENWENPTFEFTEEDGKLVGVSFEESFLLPANRGNQKSAFGMIRFYRSEMMLAVLTYLKAQEEYPFFSHKAEEIAEQILNDAGQDFAYEEYGVRITYDIEYTGFENMRRDGYLIKLDDNVEAKCSFVFRMERIGE